RLCGRIASCPTSNRLERRRPTRSFRRSKISPRTTCAPVSPSSSVHPPNGVRRARPARARRRCPRRDSRSDWSRACTCSPHMARFGVLAFVLAACGNDHAFNGGDTDGGVGYGNTFLPCDVAAVLAPCLSCHGNPPSGGAPMSLVTYNDLFLTNAAGI